jgi:hypothetical protein
MIRNELVYCLQCRRMIDHRTQRELKYKVVLKMDVCPLGDTVLNDGLVEWQRCIGSQSTQILSLRMYCMPAPRCFLLWWEDYMYSPKAVTARLTVTNDDETTFGVRIVLHRINTTLLQAQ